MKLQKCFKHKWTLISVSIVIQNSALATLPPRHSLCLFFFHYLYIQHSFNSDSSLIHSFHFLQYWLVFLLWVQWLSPFPSMLRTPDKEFDAVGIGSAYHHLASGKKQQDKQANIWRQKLSKVDSIFCVGQVSPISRCPERSFEILDFLQTACKELPSDPS